MEMQPDRQGLCGHTHMHSLHPFNFTPLWFMCTLQRISLGAGKAPVCPFSFPELSYLSYQQIWLFLSDQSAQRCHRGNTYSAMTAAFELSRMYEVEQCVNAVHLVDQCK